MDRYLIRAELTYPGGRARLSPAAEIRDTDEYAKALQIHRI